MERNGNNNRHDVMIESPDFPVLELEGVARVVYVRGSFSAFIAQESGIQDGYCSQEDEPAFRRAPLPAEGSGAANDH